jgi:cell division protein FtsI (penicillin-binding protein 3)
VTPTTTATRPSPPLPQRAARAPIGQSRPRPGPVRRPGPGPRRVRSSPTRRRGLLVRRVRAARIALVLVLAVVAARLVDVQVLHASTYQKEAAQELTQPVTVPALRGSLTDRNGVVLETSIPTEMVVADDFQVRHPVKEAKALAPLLHVAAGKLTGLLSERSGYVPLLPHLSVARARKVSALAFPGITMIDDSVDVTPDGGLASPVVGGVNAAGAGDAGLEAQYNRDLAGQAGHETLLESPLGVQLPGTPVAEKTPAVDGTGLELTLDEPLQYTAEQELAEEIVTSHATGGEAVVEDTATGQILAMANLVATPARHTTTATTSSASSGSAPASSGSGPIHVGPDGPVEEAPTNAAVTQLYEPGSVFKLVTFSAALAAGVITPQSVFTVPDQRTIDGYLFHDATPHPTENMTATQILAQSSNIGTSEVADELGETRLLAQVKQLGFGETTGLHFPGASPGLIVTPAQWATTDYVSLAIGQVDAVSPLQVLDAYNAIANGGTFVAPKLVRATVSSDGAVHKTPASATHRVVSPAVDGDLVNMFEQVVDAGTGVAAAVPGYLVAGKTGTAQIPADNGTAGYVTGAYEATFVGFAPANHPVLSAIVVLDRPTPIYGGAVAAPVFSKLMAYALHRYDVPTTPGLGGRPQVATPKTLTALVREST